MYKASTASKQKEALLHLLLSQRLLIDWKSSRAMTTNPFMEMVRWNLTSEQWSDSLLMTFESEISL